MNEKNEIELKKENRIMKTQEELNALKEEVEALGKKLRELNEEELAQVSGGSKGPRPVPIELVNNNVLSITLLTDNRLCVRCNTHVSGFGIGCSGQGLIMAGAGETGRELTAAKPLTVPGTYSYDYSAYNGEKGNGTFDVTLFNVN